MLFKIPELDFVSCFNSFCFFTGHLLKSRLNTGQMMTPSFENNPDFLSDSLLKNKENWSPGFTFENKNFSQQDHTTMTEWNAQVPIKIAESINACRSELEKMTGKWSNKSYEV